VDRLKAISHGLANSAFLTAELMIMLSCIAVKMEAGNSAETVHLLVFYAYINETHGSRSKIPSKKSSQAALRGGIYFRR
jgi:hypothetical protein